MDLQATSQTNQSKEDEWASLDHPALVSEIDPTKELHPATVALQALKYESEDPDANALSYKEEGNYFYNKKDLNKAINSYTAGLKAKATDAKLNRSLFMNRALCHFYLSIEACLILEKPDEALEIADRGLSVFPDSSDLLSAQLKALKLQAEIDKKQAKIESDKQTRENEETTFQNIIMSRGIKVDWKSKPLPIPDFVRPDFCVDSKGKIHWPVLLMYPEFQQTDFLRDVIETSTILDCLKLVFDPAQPPPAWDPQRLYSIEGNVLEVYYEDALDGKNWKSVPLDSTLKDLTIRDDFYLRRDFTVILHVVSKQSPKFYNRWKTEPVV